MTAVKARKPKYRVIARVSTRASIDQKSPKFEEWIDFEPGKVVSRFPAHAPVDEWVASGHLEAIDG